MDKPRACKVKELRAVIELCQSDLETGCVELPRDSPLLFHPGNVSRLRTLWEEGHPVAHAGYVRRDSWLPGASFTAAIAGRVCIHPDFRGREFEKVVVGDLVECARDEGCDLLLAVGDPGPWQRVGCVAAGSFSAYRISVHDQPEALTLQARQAVESDAGVLVRLHQESAVRFERSIDDWRLLLGARSLSGSPVEIWVVEHNNAVIAYLAVQSPGPNGINRVIEYGGSSVGAWQALRNIAGVTSQVEMVHKPEDREIPLLAFQLAASQMPLPPFLQANRLDLPLDAAITILNPASFFEKAEAVLAERLGEEMANDLVIAPADAAVTLEWAGQVLDIPVEELPRLVFGAAPGDTPCSMPEGPLAGVLSQMFPLPIPRIGCHSI